MNSHKTKKSAALIISLALLLCVSVGGTLAFLAAQSGPITNIFKPSKVTTQVTETIPTDPSENPIKSNVQIKNTGDTEAYIRAAVVVTWKDEWGNVYSLTPGLGEDYTMVFNTDNQSAVKTGNISAAGKWTLAADGYYYWSTPVAPGEYTGILITSCQMLSQSVNVPEAYSLHVEIMGSGIQSVPIAAVTTEWSSNVNTVTVAEGSTTLSVTPMPTTTQGGGNQ